MSAASIERMLKPLIKEAQKKGVKKVILKGSSYHNKEIVEVANTMVSVSNAREEELPGTMGNSVVIDVEPLPEIEVSYDGGKTWSKAGDID